MDFSGVRLNLAIAGLAMAISFSSHAGDAPLTLIATIQLPRVKGRIDHFGVDLKGHRLFIAALGNDTVEVVDTARNEHLRSISGFGEPQGLLYLPDKERLYVANGSADRVDIVDGRSFTVLRKIDKLGDADNIRYDATARKVVVGHGSGALRIFDPDSGEGKDIRLSGHPESFQLEVSGGRAFVNVPTARHVAVVDRAKSSVTATWEVSAGGNFPMTLDEQGRRLFVGSRSPASLLAFDIDSGKVVTNLSICGDTDDMFFDKERKRIYVICGDGQVDILRRQDANRYVIEAHVKTAPRARTGMFIPAESRLYVAAPATGGTPARVLVYTVR